MYLPGVPINIMSGFGVLSFLRNHPISKDCVVLYSKSCEQIVNDNFTPKYKRIVSSMPTPELVDGIVWDIVKRDLCDYRIVAIGGGSVIDVAKLVAFEGDADLIVVPTIPGSGSEVTKYAVLWGDKKLSFEDEALLPSLIIVDPTTMVTVPQKQLVCSMLDAVSHAIEAFTHIDCSRITTSLSNYAVEMFNAYGATSLKTRCLISMNILETIALNAGAAINSTSTHVGHSVSYPLTVRFGIPHGIAASYMIKLLSRKYSDKEADFESMYDGFDIKHKLSDYGVKKSDIPSIIDEAYGYGKMDRCRFEITKEEIAKELEESL